MSDGSEKGAHSIFISVPDQVRDYGSGIFAGRVATAKTWIRMKKDTSFDHIQNHYIFDRQLRLVVMDALERIEVALRTTNYNTMS